MIIEDDSARLDESRRKWRKKAFMNEGN